MDRVEQNIFFTSDFHIYNGSSKGGILTKDNTYSYNGKLLQKGRPFADLDEMAAELIKRWNSVVSDYDTTYYLGDLSFGTLEQTNEFLNQLNGEIILIRGNHDPLNKIIDWDKIRYHYEYKEILVKDVDAYGGNQLICMHHNPMLIWKKIKKGSIHLHGDMHFELFGTMPDYYSRKVLDVGCMGWNYTPISYNQIKNAIKQRIGDGMINDNWKNIL